MNGSTKLCVSILNVFGLLGLAGGLLGIASYFKAGGAIDGNWLALVAALVPCLGSIVTGALLVGAAEALRLLSEIRRGLVRS